MGIGVWSSKKDVHGRSDSDTPSLTYPFWEIRSSKGREKNKEVLLVHMNFDREELVCSIGLYIIYRRMYIYSPASP